MSDKLPLSTHVLDTAKGKPGKNISIKFFKLSGNSWIEAQAGEIKTDDNGRFGNFKKVDEEIRGTYKFRFEVKEYFESDELECLYPYVEVRIN